jgi:hypothetical protein
MKIERSSALPERQDNRNSSGEVVKFHNSAIAETASRIEDKRRLRIAEYDTIEYHSELREKDFAKQEKVKHLRFVEYDEIVKERKELKDLLVKFEEKKEERVTREYRDQQYLTELFMRGLYFDELV